MAYKELLERYSKTSINKLLYGKLEIHCIKELPENKILIGYKSTEYIEPGYIYLNYNWNGIVKILDTTYQIKLDNKGWKRNKDYPLIRLISKLRKV